MPFTQDNDPAVVRHRLEMLASMFGGTCEDARNEAMGSFLSKETRPRRPRLPTIEDEGWELPLSVLRRDPPRR